jgi:rSAM/selenodomain-associated transferase 2
MQISVIIPTFNEELTIGKTLDALARLVNVDEIIIVDGGSTDKTIEIAENSKRAKKLKIVNFPEANRGKQLHEGTKHASHEIFWFLHADTRPVLGCARQIKALMRYDEIVGGNFEVVFDGESRWAKFLTKLYPQLRAIGLIYGDSAIFARRSSYDKIRGYKPLPLFEDVDFYKRLQKKGRFEHVNLPVTTSSRRFENNSFMWTFARWSVFQGLYWFGLPPRFLAKGYKAIR